MRRPRIAARSLYEDLYCARGEAENRIGEQFEMFADRASSATLQANQLRLWFSAMAYVLVDTLRRVGLRHTQFADAAVTTIRLKLLKLGAQVRKSVRRIRFAIASGTRSIRRRTTRSWMASTSRWPASPPPAGSRWRRCPPWTR